MYKKNIFFLFLSLIILILFYYFSLNFRIDASSDTLVSQKDEDFKYFNYYNKIFPSNQFLVLAVKSKNDINENYIENISSITKKITNLDLVDDVLNINKLPILFLNKASFFDLSNDNIETILNSNFQLDDVINEFSKNPLYSNLIINSDKNISSLIIYLKNNKIEKDNDDRKKYLKNKSFIDLERKNLIKNIRIIIKESDSNYQYFLGGVEMIADDVISFVKKDIILFSILIIIIITLVLFVIFRQLKWVLICLFTSSYAVLIMFGLLGLLGIEVTAISSNFSSLMFILSISMNIHIINNYIHNDSKDHKLLISIKKMILPCVYTVLTTIAAFASLIISDIKPINDFGLIMILSLIIILLSSYTILPLLISLTNSKNTKEILELKLLNFFNSFSIKNSNQIILINFLIFICSIYGISKLNVENSFINYFKKDTEIYKGMKLIDSELGGTTPLDIIITFDDNIENYTNTNDESNDEDEIFSDEEIILDDLFAENEDNKIWFDNYKLSVINDIHKYLESRKEIGKVISINNLIDVANLINQKPLSIFELAILYDEIPQEYKNDLILPYLSIENNMVKITGRVRDSMNISRANLIDDVKDYLREKHSDLKEYKVNGLLILYNNMLQSLFFSQIKSIGFVVLIIFFMFIILFRSIKISIIGIIPNIFASTYILGIIGLFKIPLDIMTITIAAITIGIAVDNTIHYLYRYKENLNATKDKNLSIKLTHNSVGKAVLTTSLTITLGFSVLIFSNFIPSVLFGVFTSLAMILAMIGVLVTLPSLINKIL